MAARSKLVRWEDVLAEELRDSVFRAEWDRTALTRAVANAVVAYRTREHLSQQALAARLGMKQPALARLKLGEHNPSFETLERLASENRSTRRGAALPSPRTRREDCGDRGRAGFR